MPAWSGILTVAPACAGLTNFNAITSKKATIKGPVHRTVHKGDNSWQVCTCPGAARWPLVQRL